MLALVLDALRGPQRKLLLFAHHAAVMSRLVLTLPLTLMRKRTLSLSLSLTLALSLSLTLSLTLARLEQGLLAAGVPLVRIDGGTAHARREQCATLSEPSP